MRASYLEAQRRDYGRRAIVVLPILYPRELLTALDLLAVELWGPPGPPRGPDAGRIQAYVCALARNALAFLASGGADACDAALFPHTCDSLQGLATLAPDLGGWRKPALRLPHPKGEDRPSARAFLARELRALAAALEPIAGRSLDEDRLRRAIALHEAIDAERLALLERRACSPLGDRALYALLRRGEWLWPEDHLAELRGATAGLADRPVQRGVPILVTGYVPEPPGLLDSLEAAGAYVAADDYAAVGRRAIRPIAVGAAAAAGAAGAVAARPAIDAGPAAAAGPALADPFDDVAARLLAAPPCPTRAADQGRRIAWLLALAAGAGAAGVLVHVQKSCEPELFDVPAIRAAFAARGLGVLVLEGELEAELSGQAVTRVEAFVEMLADGRRVA